MVGRTRQRSAPFHRFAVNREETRAATKSASKQSLPNFAGQLPNRAGTAKRPIAPLPTADLLPMIIILALLAGDAQGVKE